MRIPPPSAAALDRRTHHTVLIGVLAAFVVAGTWLLMAGAPRPWALSSVTSTFDAVRATCAVMLVIVAAVPHGGSRSSLASYSARLGLLILTSVALGASAALGSGTEAGGLAWAGALVLMVRAPLERADAERARQMVVRRSERLARLTRPSARNAGWVGVMTGGAAVLGAVLIMAVAGASPRAAMVGLPLVVTFAAALCMMGQSRAVVHASTSRTVRMAMTIGVTSTYLTVVASAVQLILVGDFAPVGAALIVVASVIAGSTYAPAWIPSALRELTIAGVAVRQARDSLVAGGVRRIA